MTNLTARLAAGSRVEMALGPDGKPARVPLLLTASEEEAERATAAQARRAARLAQRWRSWPSLPRRTP